MGQDGHLEAVLGDVRYKSYRWYVNGLTRCRAVARIQTKITTAWAPAFWLLGLSCTRTCRHWWSSPTDTSSRKGWKSARGLPHSTASTPTQAARSNFRSPTSAGPNPRRRPGSIPPSFDSRNTPTRSHRSRSPAGSRTWTEIPPRAYIIGHPRGLSTPQFSLQDNVLLDHDDRFLHYRSPTEPGSSGSPVFNDSGNSSRFITPAGSTCPA